nr:MAG TPA: hypothetical protein [Caudoviricetes sp.]
MISRFRYSCMLRQISRPYRQTAQGSSSQFLYGRV